MVNSLLKTDLVISLSFFGLLLEHAWRCLWILEGCNHSQMQQVFSSQLIGRNLFQMFGPNSRYFRKMKVQFF